MDFSQWGLNFGTKGKVFWKFKEKFEFAGIFPLYFFLTSAPPSAFWCHHVVYGQLRNKYCYLAIWCQKQIDSEWNEHKMWELEHKNRTANLSFHFFSRPFVCCFFFFSPTSREKKTKFDMPTILFIHHEWLDAIFSFFSFGILQACIPFVSIIGCIHTMLDLIRSTTAYIFRI